MKTVGAHQNLVSILGCITINRQDNPLLIVEYCGNGDLQTFLRNAWDKLNDENYRIQKSIEADVLLEEDGISNKMYDLNNLEKLEQKFQISLKDLLSFGYQVARGMEYLSSLRVLHRDLAARNVLVCDDCRTVKISDFGLSRDVYQNDVYCKNTDGRLPIRWMALESMTHQRYTTQSDVWSYGILLWEIVTLGGNPYPGIDIQDLLFMLQDGYRMKKPSNCSDELYEIMSRCWSTLPKDRPTFAELVVSMEAFLEDQSDYFRI